MNGSKMNPLMQLVSTGPQGQADADMGQMADMRRRYDQQQEPYRQMQNSGLDRGPYVPPNYNPNTGQSMPQRVPNPREDMRAYPLLPQRRFQFSSGQAPRSYNT